MKLTAKIVAFTAAFSALSCWTVLADDAKITLGDGGPSIEAEAGGVKVGASNDGVSMGAGGVTVSENDDGRSITAGGVTVTEGNDGSYKAEVKVGERADVGVAAGGDNWNAQAGGGASAEAGWTVGVDEDGNVNAEVGTKVGVDGSVSIGVNGQLGDDQNNIHGSGKVTLSAEVVAEIASKFTVNKDGSVEAKAEAKVGAAVSADGTIKGGVTVWGVPIDVVLTGGVSAGAEAGASAGAKFDAKKGTVTVTLEASAVLGVGAHGNVSVEIGVVQLAKAIGTGLGNAVGAIEEGANKVGEAVGSTLDELWDWLDEKMNGRKDDDPLNNEAEGDGDSSGRRKSYRGLKSLKLVH